MVDPATGERLTWKKVHEDNPQVAAFLDACRRSDQRQRDVGESAFWVCLVFQSWEQKQEFLRQLAERSPEVPVLHDQYADGEALAGAVGLPVTPCDLPPIRPSPVYNKFAALVKENELAAARRRRLQAALARKGKTW